MEGKEYMKCTECGREIGENLKFCKYCGATLKQQIILEKPIVENRIVCKHCGASIKKGVVYCTQCGEPVNNPLPVPSTPEKDKKHKAKEKKKKRGKLGLVMIILMSIISMSLIGGIVYYFLGDSEVLSFFRKETHIESDLIEDSGSSNSESETEAESNLETQENSAVTDINNTTDQIVEEIIKERDNINQKIVTGTYSSMQVETGVTAFVENDNLVEISAGQYSGNNDYSRTYYYVNGTLVYAEYVGTDMHSFYFDNDKMVRWTYYQDSSDSSNAINYDGENTTTYLLYESNILNDSVEMVKKWITAKQNSNQTQPVTVDHEFIFANSSTAYLSESDLNGLSEWECLVARNEICARHGCMFNNEKLKNYFNTCPWYRGTMDSDTFNAQYDSLTNAIERANISTIKAYEHKMGYNNQ